MWIRASGQLRESTYLLNTAVSSHICVEGEEIVLIDTPLTCLEEEFFEELGSYLTTEDSIDKIFLTQADFDTCGGIVFLRKKYPEIKLYTSSATAQKLAEEEVVSEIYELNRLAAEALERELSYSKQDFIDSLKVDQVIGDGDRTSLGGEVEIELIETPGQAKDSVCYYILPDFVLVAGESLGAYNGREQFFPCFQHQYQSYLNSLDKISNLDSRAVCFSHAGVLSGDLARSVPVRARSSAEQFFSKVKLRLSQGEVIEEIASSIAAEWAAEGVSPSGPFRPRLEKLLLEMVTCCAKQEAFTTEEEPEVFRIKIEEPKEDPAIAATSSD